MGLVGMVEYTGCMFVACRLPTNPEVLFSSCLWAGNAADLLCPEQVMTPGTVHRMLHAQ